MKSILKLILIIRPIFAVYKSIYVLINHQFNNNYLALCIEHNLSIFLIYFWKGKIQFQSFELLLLGVFELGSFKNSQALYLKLHKLYLRSCSSPGKVNTFPNSE